MKVQFFIGEHHKNFKKKIEKELYAMDILGVDYYFHKRTNVLLPKVFVNAIPAVGLDGIQDLLQEELQRFVQHFHRKVSQE